MLWSNWLAIALLAGTVVFSTAEQATSRSSKMQATGNSDTRDLAVLIHNRIVGVPAQGDTLIKMVELLQVGKVQEAAMLATEHPFFYDYKLPALFTPWSNATGDAGLNYNDMVLTMVGMVRDDVPFNQVLSADLFYTTYDYEAKEVLPGISVKEKLKQHKQSEHLHKLRPAGISGVLSTTGFGQAFYNAGTNRRATAAVLKNFLCHEIEELRDKKTPANWVRQDVGRTPAGDPNLFYERCVSCHAGLDALSGWTVYYDQTRYDSSRVHEKIIKNNLLKPENKDEGRNYTLTKNQNDSFTNLWTEGKNASLGWRGETSGRGAKEFGEMMTRSKAFSSCMARHVYKSVCYLDPEKGDAQTKKEQLAEKFEKDNYNMRKLFAATAAACLTKAKVGSAGSGGGG